MRVTIEEALNCTEWKTCTKCGDEKKEVFFSISRGKRKAQCKDCDAKAYGARKALLIVQPKPSLLKRIVTWVLS